MTAGCAWNPWSRGKDSTPSDPALSAPITRIPVPGIPELKPRPQPAKIGPGTVPVPTGEKGSWLFSDQDWQWHAYIDNVFDHQRKALLQEVQDFNAKYDAWKKTLRGIVK